MMVAGTYVLTDTIDRSFERIFTQSNEGIDAVVTIEAGRSRPTTARCPPFPASILEAGQAVDGVAAAEGSIADNQVSIIGADGEPRGGNGAPSLGFSVRPRALRPAHLRRGRSADQRRPGRDRQGLGRRRGLRASATRSRSPARRRPATTRSRDRHARRRRLVRRRDDHRAHPARGPARHRQGGRARPDLVAADEGVPPERLAANLNAALPDTLEVETGAENVQSQRDDIGEFIGFLKTALLIFAGVALFVAAFLIFNTFSITVAQRTREFAMLRTLGANRRQILTTRGRRGVHHRASARRSLGVAGRDRLRPAIGALFAALGIDLPATRHRDRHPRTIVVGLVLGTGLTVLAALLPALRATRVPPVTGLRDGAVPATPSERRKRTDRRPSCSPVVGLALMVLGVFDAICPGGHLGRRRRRGDPARRRAAEPAAGQAARVASSARRSSACAASRGGSRARTRSATRRARPRPRRR